MSKVLIADDDRISCKLLSSLLTKWGYQADIVYDGVEAKRELTKPGAAQLAILDWMMPGLDGIQVIKAVRAASREAYTYMLLLTSKAQKQDLLEGLDAGADDYLKKPLDSAELRARLRVGARILGLEHRLIAARETTEHQATHDLLTGLYNRATIIELLNQEFSRSRNEGYKLSVLIVDIDQFDMINDTYGHVVGDQVIKHIANKIGSPLRPKDSIGRFRGEQFLILAPNCTLNQAMITAERLINAVLSHCK
jgi:two-component system cell cycle response regulator